MTRKDVKGDQPSGGETTWTNTGATRYGRGQHKTGSFGDDMLRPSPNHGTQRLPNDDDDVICCPRLNVIHSILELVLDMRVAHMYLLGLAYACCTLRNRIVW